MKLHLIAAIVIVLTGVSAQVGAAQTSKYVIDARAAYEKGAKAEALRQLNLGVAANDRDAIVTLAIFYDEGFEEFLSKDQNAASRLFKQAADLGDLDSTFQTGVRYLKGVGLPQSNYQAAKYLLSIAEEDGKAREILAKMHKNGAETEACMQRAVLALGFTSSRETADVFNVTEQKYVRPFGSGVDMMTVRGPFGRRDDADYYRAAGIEASSFSSVVSDPMETPSGTLQFERYEGERKPSANTERDLAAIKKACVSG